MPSYRVTAESRLDMADAVVLCAEHARTSGRDYAFGPMRQEDLMQSGLLVLGDTEALAAELARLPRVTVRLEG